MGAKISYFRSSESEFHPYFQNDDGLVYSHNIHGLIVELEIPLYTATEWRLYIDNSKRNLKRVLFYNKNSFGAVSNRAFSLRARRIQEYRQSH